MTGMLDDIKAWAQDYLADSRYQYRAAKFSLLAYPKRCVIKITDRSGAWSGYYVAAEDCTRWELVAFGHGDCPAYVYTACTFFYQIEKHFEAPREESA